MDDQAKRAAIAAIGERHVENKKQAFRSRIVTQLFEQNGEVSAAEVDARFAAEWTPPTDQQVADVVAAKTLASVEFHQREVEWETNAVAGAEAKLTKAVARQAELVRVAEAAAEAARESTAVADAEERLRDARELADFAAQFGNAAAAPKGVATAAKGKGGA